MKKTKWKAAFITLGIINILIFAVFAGMILMPSKDQPIPKKVPADQEDVQFHINATKEDLNKMINHYIQKEGLNGPIDYSVYLKDDVELYGTIPLFTSNLQLKMTLEPKALDNGDLILKQKSISLGQLDLPVSYVMELIKNKYKLPDWVSIQPNDHLIYVSLQKMKLKSDIKVRADEFNLKDDKIKFTLLVPTN
ncbi:YpmS family protein [Falsibacillus albus]|uniref:DUF2140 family protein n=1 Tax=Falsibacillus albus TaxID=2478915 RepID=A0A3L7JY10_9BACI|nr:YpmS family protein [Falsibacillus albus]RLQ95185.1 DUF2140 family protein [Falsibacillus albus]